MHILYLTAEQWPTFRADIAVLFGKYLPRFGVTCDLVTEKDINTSEIPVWAAGKSLLCTVPKNRAAQYVKKFLHQCKVLITTDYTIYQAIQVRDMTLIAIFAIVICKLNKRPFFYWLSYPQSEGQIQRAKARGFSAGLRYFFPLLQGYFGKFLLYKIILPNAHHIFVQSQNMLEMLVLKGINPLKMTPVPMGVDLEVAMQAPIPSKNLLLTDKQVLVYLGTLDRVRQIEILFDTLIIVRRHLPNTLLVLAGDTEDPEHRACLKKQADEKGLSSHILWTGWLPAQEAWGYVTAAEIGLSPIPRGYLLDMSSPTKAVEYMALGIPVVMNDNPDQMLVAQQSGAAICTPLTAENFANSIITLLQDEGLRQTFKKKGIDYVTRTRGYQQIAENLSVTYHSNKQILS